MLELLSQRSVWLHRRPLIRGRRLTFSCVSSSKVLLTDEERSGKRRPKRAISGGPNWTFGPLRIYSSGFMTHQKHSGDAAHYSPPLVPHAPRLSHAALLPHFYHACEGLHTWLPLGDQRHLPLRTHIGPGMKTNMVSMCYQGVEFESPQTDTSGEPNVKLTNE